MRYYSDCTLTDIQRALKWSIYCEIELEDDNDIKAVLKSLLADLDSN